VIIDVDIYGQIRHMYEVEKKSKRAIAQQLGISRNTVKKYCAGENVPWERREYTRDNSVITSDIETFIKGCFEEDEEEGIEKQSHTARKIYNRLVNEKDFEGGESTVRRYVNMIKEKAREGFIPLSFEPGEAAQIDWGEAVVYMNGEKTKIQLLCVRLCFSRDVFVVSFYRQNSESFLEGLIKAFEYFGGVPKRVIFDNAKVAVKEGFGKHAKSQEYYKALSAHYVFTPEYCNISKGNEKGLVENLVGWSRRNILVPIPRVSDMNELNGILKKSCMEYRTHNIKGQKMSVGESFQLESKALLALPKYSYDPAKRVLAKVNDFSTVRFHKNNYSVPAKLVGKEVTVRGYGNQVSIVYQNLIVAEYQRSYGSDECFYRLEHYIDLLERKPRAVLNARPVKECVVNELLEWGIKFPNGAKDLVKLLRLGIDHGMDRLLKIKEEMADNRTDLSMDIVRSYFYTVPDSKFSAIAADTVRVKEVSLSAYDEIYGVAQ